MQKHTQTNQLKGFQNERELGFGMTCLEPENPLSLDAEPLSQGALRKAFFLPFQADSRAKLFGAA